MARQRAAEFWTGLPVEARRLLVHGSTGREQLVGLARFMPALAAGFLTAAWAERPLDGALAQLLLTAVQKSRSGLPEPAANLLRAQANFWSPPADPAWQGDGTREALRAAILAHLVAEPKNLFWKQEAWDFAWSSSLEGADWELAAAALEEAAWPRTLAPLRQRFAAQANLCRGDAHTALACLNAAASLSGFGEDASLRASCLLGMGRRDEAADVLRQAVAAAPWRVNELLRLSDLESGADTALAPVPGRVAILLYTFNKARELDETLGSLAATNIPGVPLYVLDNGCTDTTARVLATWRERLGERLSVVSLPVNIGAPAARNWLLSLPEVRGHEYVVFLDDDVSLPPDWLLRLGAAAVRLPSASVWGCRVVDETRPLVVQNVDYTPLAPRPGDQLLVLPTLHLGAPDLGRFDYLRPCASVTGCCHLLRTADLAGTGGFDIRFAPSQYDDLERDLRLGLVGGHAAYQGHLTVRHKRLSGQAAERSPAAIGNAAANAHKLQTKHTLEDFTRLNERGTELLEQDLLARLRALPF